MPWSVCQSTAIRCCAAAGSGGEPARSNTGKSRGNRELPNEVKSALSCSHRSGFSSHISELVPYDEPPPLLPAPRVLPLLPQKLPR